MTPADLAKNPLDQFRAWLREAEKESGLEFPNAMSLATVGPGGRPSLRMVLLKQVSKSGFVFFTNHESRKGRELAANSHAALCFYWEKLGLQVRAEGKATKISRSASFEYFHSRPRESQLGAWASPQSREIGSRNELEESVEEARNRFQKQSRIPLPAFWGGYCLRPSRVEFWKNGPNRLHDRIVYLRKPKGWDIRRLAP
jgi:pyridoxamine 5'-phosphate oxidase